MELFIFLEMGGNAEDISLVMLPSEESGRAALKARFSAFDCASAKCYSTDDTQRLLGIIEAGFGDLDSFNELVRAVLLQTSNGELAAQPMGALSQTHSGWLNSSEGSLSSKSLKEQFALAKMSA